MLPNTSARVMGEQTLERGIVVLSAIGTDGKLSGLAAEVFQ
jgi:hypothetical protein